MKKKEPYFSRTDTKVVKGLAIILMLMHHLWAFPDRIAGGALNHLFTIYGESALVFFGTFGKICVSLFFFVGGYGIYKLSEKKGFNILINIKKLYINYWKVFLIFIPIAFLFFRYQNAYCEDPIIFARYYIFNKYDLVANFLGLSYTLNKEWWFLWSYVIAIISFPLIKKVLGNRSAAVNLFLIIVGTIIATNILPALAEINELGLSDNELYKNLFILPVPYISCFWAGILFSKDDLMTKLKTKLSEVIKLNPLYDLIGIGLIVFIRQFSLGASFDILFVPFLIILFLDLVNRSKLLVKVFELFGNHSTNMWLLHSFLCYYFSYASKVVTYLRWGVPCLLVLIILSLIGSYTVNLFWKLISIGYRATKNKVLEVHSAITCH